MKGDFSGLNFDPARHFTRVLMQQGRVQLDSDWNEQMEILWHYLRTLATDLIGPHGGPAGDQLGFKIDLVMEGSLKDKLKDLSIGLGRYYVDGILCENDATATKQYRPLLIKDAHSHDEERVEGAADESEEVNETDEAEEMKRTPGGVIDVTPVHQAETVTYFTQSGYPLTRAEMRERYKLPDAPFLVYLDVWERSVSAGEDPSIREVALGGPDTAARSQVVWQVRVERLPADAKEVTCDEFDAGEFWKGFINRLQPDGRGTLIAKAREPEAGESTDPCIISPDALYRGAENQLYRVEIHTGSVNPGNYPPTFKWSRDNGSNVYPILSIKDRMLFLEHLGRDERAGLQAGDWVEVITDDDTLLGSAEPLYQVESVDSTDMTVTLKKAPPALYGERDTHALLRRWDQRAGDQRTGGLDLSKSDNAALIKQGWLNLEDGIQIMFQRQAVYRTGDYWLIPARTATGDIEWPRNDANEPRALPPHGVEHHYAPLAGVFPPSATRGLHVVDWRRVFSPAAECFVSKK